jgi:hypothetical protein
VTDVTSPNYWLLILWLAKSTVVANWLLTVARSAVNRYPSHAGRCSYREKRAQRLKEGHHAYNFSNLGFGECATTLPAVCCTLTDIATELSAGGLAGSTIKVYKVQELVGTNVRTFSNAELQVEFQ